MVATNILPFVTLKGPYGFASPLATFWLSNFWVLGAPGQGVVVGLGGFRQRLGSMLNPGAGPYRQADPLLS